MESNMEKAKIQEFEKNPAESIRKSRKKFLENPREGIIDLITYLEQSKINLPMLPIISERPERLILFRDIYAEYFLLIGKMLQSKKIQEKELREPDTFAITVLQAYKEMENAARNYEQKRKPKDHAALGIAKAYAAALELLWKKFKKIVLVEGLNPKKKHLDIEKLKEKVRVVEKRYQINLSILKSLLNSKIRNPTQHLEMYFEHPNWVVFQDTKDLFNPIEVERLTSEELYDRLITTSLAMIAIQHAELAWQAIIVRPLLKLSDKELIDYTKKYGVYDRDQNS